MKPISGMAIFLLTGNLLYGYPTVDHLENELGKIRISEKPMIVEPENIPVLAGKQLELCMIGDSVTWAGEGDYFRYCLLKEIPELAFIGTHSAALGYSHAGEGGNTTTSVLKRIWNTVRIPDAPYYHLLIGINDCASARKEEQIASVSAGIYSNMKRIIKELLARPGTRKVFLATSLPGPFQAGKEKEQTLRDKTGSTVNSMIRAGSGSDFPSDKVILIDYETPLRKEKEKWHLKMNGAHPTRIGYRRLAAIAAPILRREMKASPVEHGKQHFGVRIINLWKDENALSEPLIPGWYVLSFDIAQTDGILKILLKSAGTFPQRYRLSKEITCREAAGIRVQYTFMTGYEGYSYLIAPAMLEVTGGKISRIQLEKMRPSGKASIYGKGTFIDTESPVCLGEKLQ